MKKIINNFLKVPIYRSTKETDFDTKEIIAPCYDSLKEMMIDFEDEMLDDENGDYDQLILWECNVDVDVDELKDYIEDVYRGDEEAEEIEDIIKEYILSGDYDIEFDFEAIKNYSYKEARENEALRIENEYEMYLLEVKLKFKKEYKGYIHIEEQAGYMKDSYYAYLLCDVDEKLISSKDGKLLSKTNTHREYDVLNKNDWTLSTQSHISRNFQKINNNHKVICVRIADHSQKKGWNNITDKYLSIAISRDFIYCHSQEGCEEQDTHNISTWDAEPIDRDDNFAEYRYLYDSEVYDAADANDVINEFLN